MYIQDLYANNRLNYFVNCVRLNFWVNFDDNNNRWLWSKDVAQQVRVFSAQAQGIVFGSPAPT